MFENKLFTVSAVVSFVLLAAIVAFQYMEMDRYGLIDQLLNK